MLKGFTPRLYQETILATAALKNTLVVLPTGMGKTGVALLLTVQRLKQRPGTKVLIVAPTKPLAEQHLTTFTQFLELPENAFALFTGEVSPEKRAELWNDAQIIFSTPQGLENDLIGDKVDITQVSLLVVDEAHRAVGDYSYVFLAKQYLKKAEWPRILALTASPGSDLEKIEEVCNNLHIEAVEIRTESDPDVAPYIQEIESETIKVELPDDFKKIKHLLEQCIKGKLETLCTLGIKGSFMSKKELLAVQAKLHAQMSSGERDFDAMKAISILAEVMKAEHALELLETQGAFQLNKYLEGLYQEAKSGKTKAVKISPQTFRLKARLFSRKNCLNKKENIQRLTRFANFSSRNLKKTKC